MNFRFALAQPEDAETLTATAVRAFAEEAKKYGGNPPGLASVERHLSPIQAGLYYKILAADQIVGGVIIEAKGEGHYHLNTIFVDLAWQNKGIGAQAIKFLEQAVPQAKRWSLKTPALSHGNHHFYEKMGFVKVREIGPAEFPDDKNNLSFFIYEKRLSP